MIKEVAALGELSDVADFEQLEGSTSNRVWASNSGIRLQTGKFLPESRRRIAIVDFQRYSCSLQRDNGLLQAI